MQDRNTAKGGRRLVSNRLPFIDGLRAVAVLSVLSFHAGLPGTPHGYLGVDIFFVISGFLITGQIVDGLSTGNFSFGDFYARRTLRIFPPLLLVITVTLFAASVLPILPTEIIRTARSAIVSALMVANWYFLDHTGYFAASAEREPLLHLWSLGVEEQYYVLAPAALVLLASLQRFRPRHPLFWWSAATALVFAGSLAAAVLFARSKPDIVFYATPCRAWELAAGALVALALRTSPNLPKAILDLGALAGLLMVGVVFVGPQESPSSEVLLQVLVVVGTACLLACCTLSPNAPPAKLLRLSAFVSMGTISYSLYLWHWPLLSLSRMSRLDPPSLFERVMLGVAVPIILAALTFAVVERPIRRWRQNRAPGRSSFHIIVAGLAGSIGVVLLSGATLLVADRINRSPYYQLFANALEPIMANCKMGVRNGGPLPGCVIGTAPEPRLLLWGDSHALSLAPAVLMAVKRSNNSAHLQWEGGCPPLAGVPLYFGATEWTGCMRRNDTVLDWLKSKELGKVTGVVIAGAWGLHGGQVSSTGPNPALLRTAMARTVGSLQGLGLRVLVVGPVPKLPRAAPDCIFHGGEKNRRCGIARAVVDTASLPSNGALRAAVEDVEGARFVDPALALCDAIYCYAGGTEGVYYSDDNHLSAAGAERV